MQTIFPADKNKFIEFSARPAEIYKILIRPDRRVDPTRGHSWRKDAAVIAIDWINNCIFVYV